jgi:hypothetical protein
LGFAGLHASHFIPNGSPSWDLLGTACSHALEPLWLLINQPKGKKMNQTPSSLNELPPCPNSPNCVCSDGQQNGHWISPIRFTGSAKVAWAKWLNIIKEEKNGNNHRKQRCLFASYVSYSAP